MPLSEYEQRVLRGLEADLAEQDPRWVAHMAWPPRRWRARRYLITAGLAAVLGSVLFVVGLALASDAGELVAVLAWLLMSAALGCLVAAVCVADRHRRPGH